MNRAQVRNPLLVVLVTQTNWGVQTVHSKRNRLEGHYDRIRETLGLPNCYSCVEGEELRHSTHAYTVLDIVSDLLHFLLDFPAQTGVANQHKDADGMVRAPNCNSHPYRGVDERLRQAAYESVKPASGCKILICLTIVLFPDSPAPTNNKHIIP